LLITTKAKAAEKESTEEQPATEELGAPYV